MDTNHATVEELQKENEMLKKKISKSKHHFEFSKLILVFDALLCIFVILAVLKMATTPNAITSIIQYVGMYICAPVVALFATGCAFYYNKSKTYNNLRAQQEYMEWEINIKIEHPELFTNQEIKSDVNKRTSAVETSFNNKTLNDINSAISESFTSSSK